MIETGGFSLPASVPGADPASMGWVWIGVEKMTAADVLKLAEELSDEWGQTVDPRNLVIDPFARPGKYAARYTTYYNLMTGTQSSGGIGSVVYETQLTGDGVEFAKEPIWYTDCTGEFQKGIPGNAGEHHSVDMGGGYSEAFEGPAPDSEAADLLGNGNYDWDSARKLYVIRS